MHNGFQVLKLQNNERMSGEIAHFNEQNIERMSKIAHYNEHSSLAYGLDFRCADNKVQLASCSFYDCLLKVWNINVD